jgi:hypothetical protein
MSARDDEIRRVVAELDVHIAEVEADIKVLKALIADHEAPGGEDLGLAVLASPVRQAQKLLDGLLAGYVFEEDGLRYVGTDTVALGWRLGPPGKPVARGRYLTIRDGCVSVVRALIASEPDA